MKLRNKKTGEIGEPRIQYQEIYIDTENHMTYCYNTLRSVFEEWEDYDEPEVVYPSNDNELVIHFENSDECQEFYNKLLAWKRLKDKGFRFEGWDNTDRSTIHNFSLFVAIEDLEGVNKDLDLLFGGEE